MNATVRRFVYVQTSKRVYSMNQLFTRIIFEYPELLADVCVVIVEGEEWQCT